VKNKIVLGTYQRCPRPVSESRGRFFEVHLAESLFTLFFRETSAKIALARFVIQAGPEPWVLSHTTVRSTVLLYHSVRTDTN
jgi:hypothetical protein